MPPKRGRGGVAARRGAAARRGVRVEATDASSESVQAENTEQVNAAQVAAAQENARAAETAALLEELQRYRAQFGDLRESPVRRGADGVAAPPHREPNVAAQDQHPPPPVQVQAQELSYWQAMEHLKSMGTELFGGKPNPTAADNWKKKLERNFDAFRCPVEYRKELAVQYLKDDALVWWDGVVSQTRGRYELNWEDFQEEFTRKYFPREAMDQMESEFQDLRQGNRDIREYEEEFNRLKRFAGKYMTEQDMIHKFMKGMRIELKNRCRIRTYNDMVELVETAAAQEKGLEEEFKQNKNIQGKAERGAVTHKRTWETANAGRSSAQPNVCGTCGKRHHGSCRGNVICFRCNKTGHYQKDCTWKAQTFRGCYRCGQSGHNAKDCMTNLPGQQQGNRNREQLPPPPKRQAVAPRVFLAGEHNGAEPIAGT